MLCYKHSQKEITAIHSTNKQINMFLDGLNLKKRSEKNTKSRTRTNAHAHIQIPKKITAIEYWSKMERKWESFSMYARCEYKHTWMKKNKQTPTKIPDRQSEVLTNKLWFDFWMSTVSLLK